ncbi:MAG TPA: hypothetical protein PLT06_09375 [Syntrophorhabdaceae bacterium]|nr:hypothetical protein [Syntrophorhabdaceae bacterium]HOS06618.1 hypothetical protein [Syntrophorhabdaceae bacterium]HPL42080.1 hypothetical protein [Syntrophorhabdaceae bacterium]HQJ95028.1 hypothetical protein [Syntrophorhabdaceae bacterium]
MELLQGILSESKEYYINIKGKIEKNLAKLPKGSIKAREISGRKYYYLQQRVDKKIKHHYLGKEKPEDLIEKIEERKRLKSELKKVNNALKILKRTEGKKYGLPAAGNFTLQNVNKQTL